MILASALASLATAQNPSRVSVTATGVESSFNHYSGLADNLILEPAERWVGLSSAGHFLPPASGTLLFLFDRWIHGVAAIGVRGSGVPTFDVRAPAVSDDLRFVAFTSYDRSLSPTPPVNGPQVYLLDRANGSVLTLSARPDGAPGNQRSDRPSIDANGTRIVFESRSSDLVPGDTNGATDVFLWERGMPGLRRISVSAAGVEGDANSGFAKISADGRYVFFWTVATNLHPGTNTAGNRLFVHDLQSGVLEVVTVNLMGVPSPSTSSLSRSISGDGRFVCFESTASDLVVNDQNRASDVFVRDRLLGITTRVSEDTGGIEGDGPSTLGQISRDGRYVSFASDATNWRWGIAGSGQVYRRDLQTGTTEIVSADAFGVPGNRVGRFSAISADGSVVAFVSAASNLVPDDRNGWVEDIFVRDLSCPSISAAYELACSGSNGIPPLLYLAGCPARGRDVLLWLRGTLPYAPALLLFGRTRGNLSLGSGCALLVDQPLGVALPLATDAGGVGSLGFRIPPLPSLLGDLTLQAIVLDPGLPQLLSSTRGIDVRMR